MAEGLAEATAGCRTLHDLGLGVGLFCGSGFKLRLLLYQEAGTHHYTGARPRAPASGVYRFKVTASREYMASKTSYDTCHRCNTMSCTISNSLQIREQKLRRRKSCLSRPAHRYFVGDWPRITQHQPRETAPASLPFDMDHVKRCLYDVAPSNQCTPVPLPTGLGAAQPKEALACNSTGSLSSH